MLLLASIIFILFAVRLFLSMFGIVLHGLFCILPYVIGGLFVIEVIFILMALLGTGG